jgi:hypothetical protein
VIFVGPFSFGLASASSRLSRECKFFIATPRLPALRSLPQRSCVRYRRVLASVAAPIAVAVPAILVKLANDILKVSSGLASSALILRVGCDAFSGIDQKAILPEIIQDDPFPRFQISTTFLRDRVRNEDQGINLLWNHPGFQ